MLEVSEQCPNCDVAADLIQHRPQLQNSDPSTLREIIPHLTIRMFLERSPMANYLAPSPTGSTVRGCMQVHCSIARSFTYTYIGSKTPAKTFSSRQTSPETRAQVKGQQSPFGYQLCVSGGVRANKWQGIGYDMSALSGLPHRRSPGSSISGTLSLSASPGL